MTTDGLRQDADRREREAKAAKCRACGGRGGLFPSCPRCDDSTDDHACPDWVTCVVCAGAGVAVDAAALRSAGRDRLLADTLVWLEGADFFDRNEFRINTTMQQELLARFAALEAP